MSNEQQINSNGVSKLVWYDVESVGLDTTINQIAQFAAIVTDLEMNVIDKYNIRIKVKDGVPIFLGACLVTGMIPSNLLTVSSCNEYQFSCQLKDIIQGAVIIGYNNHGYDDKMITQCLYQNLHSPYMYKMGNTGSLDVLTLVASVTNLTKDYKAELNDKGSKMLKLGSWCNANGIVVDESKTHDALYDVELTIEAAKLIKTKSPQIFQDWFDSRLSAVVGKRLMPELYFRNVNVYFGKAYEQTCTYIMSDEKSAFLFDLAYDPKDVFSYTEEQLLDTLTVNKAKKYKPIRHIKINKAPMLIRPKDTVLDDETRKQYMEKIQYILNNPAIMAKFKAVCTRYTEQVNANWATTPVTKGAHVAERIHESFTEFGSTDELLMQDFHQTPRWTKRVKIAGQFTDERLKEIAYKIVYDNAPHLLPKGKRKEIRDYNKQYLFNPNSKITINSLITEVTNVMADPKKTEGKERIVKDYLMYLVNLQK